MTPEKRFIEGLRNFGKKPVTHPSPPTSTLEARVAELERKVEPIVELFDIAQPE